ncbi:GNAT family N-acetyltransferase [Cohnella yongneupensis]|uniref:GNAT family N-acetyltransferase n=1 Tax=Cohnella yongneupensis TaxID=425006 RepID=A0ABW0R4M4_9BACL
MGVALVRAIDQDAQSIYDIQIQAFAPLLEKYRDYDTSPANETLDRVRARINAPRSAYFKIIEAGVLVGAIRVWWKEETQFWISPIFIAPVHQGRGLSQQALALAEQLYPEAESWELATILEETRNCYLYEKIGYERTGVQQRLNDQATLIYYKKTISQ